MKNADNPMHPTQRLANAPRCTARTKATGCRCNGPAVKGWSVCRMHGARGGAPEGKRNGMWRHGGRTKESETIRKLTQALTGWAKAVDAND
ncbi:MAG: hypothetical protein ACK4GC_05775 [Paracoccaceae bacterium]